MPALIRFEQGTNMYFRAKSGKDKEFDQSVMPINRGFVRYFDFCEYVKS